MTEFARPGQSDFIRELVRLNAEQHAAYKSGDLEAIELANHELAMFLRYNGENRLAEYFARQAAGKAQV